MPQRINKTKRVEPTVATSVSTEGQSNNKREKQTILSPTGLYKFVEDKVDITQSPIFVFFFSDKVLTIDNTVYFRPLSIVYIKDKTLNTFGIDELVCEFGENFGMKFTTTKFRQLDLKEKVNVLRIYGKEKEFMTKEGDIVKFHNCGIVDFETMKPHKNKLYDAYYSTAETFEYVKTEKSVGTEDEWANLSV